MCFSNILQSSSSEVCLPLSIQALYRLRFHFDTFKHLKYFLSLQCIDLCKASELCHNTLSTVLERIFCRFTIGPMLHPLYSVGASVSSPYSRSLTACANIALNKDWVLYSYIGGVQKAVLLVFSTSVNVKSETEQCHSTAHTQQLEADYSPHTVNLQSL